MKLLLTILMFSISAMAEETTPAATPEVTFTTPKQVCEALAKAAAADDFKVFAEWTAMPQMMHPEGKNGSGKSCPMMAHKGKECKDKKCTDKDCPMHKGEKGYKHAGMHGMPSEADFHQMHSKEMARLKDLSCKEEKVSGDHAWVEATSQKETRLVPFKMVEGKWKFDMHAYHAFYNPPMNK